MAYQNVNTPVFYINVIEFLGSTGVDIPDKFRTLPVNPSHVGSIDVPTESQALLTDSMDKFIFVLGHNIASDNNIVMAGGILDDATINVNTVSYSGFSLLKYTGDLTGITVDADVGSFVVGNTYTMSHSPDLSLTLTREYGGVKTIETKGGSTLSNDFGSKPPAWGDLGAWELGSADPKLSRSGRRIWDLSFSYLSAKDIMGAPELVDQSPATAELGGGDALTPNLVGLGWDSDDVDDNDSFAYNLMNHNDFYSQVIHKTNGGQLPFIFQPDSSNNSPDAFAIAKLDMNSFKFEQVANGVYNIKLKIREVW